MIRFFVATLGVSLFTLSTIQSAIAHPEPKTEMEIKMDIKPENEKTPFKLPNESEIDAIIESLPDFNGIMRDMSEVMKDDKLRSQMETTAKSFSKSLQDSGALKTDGEMPDINLALETLLRSFADKNGLGGMLGTMTDMAETMNESLEKHVPDSSNNEK